MIIICKQCNKEFKGRKENKFCCKSHYNLWQSVNGGHKAWNKGIPWDDESKRKMSLSHKGFRHSEEHKKKLSLIMRNSPNIRRGERNFLWKGGITPKNLAIRMSSEYKLWRTSVFERDNYTCIWCGKRGGKLNADHIKPFSDYPELRFAIDNGRTLCDSCHRKTDSYGWKYYHLKKQNGQN